MGKVTYLAQRVHSGEILATNGQLLPVWKEATDVARFSSRLSCHNLLEEWINANGGYTVDYDNDPFAIRKVAEDANPIVMAMPDIDIGELIGEIARLHDIYCERVAEWVKETCGVKAPRRPDPQIDLSGARHSGIYRPGNHTCTYTLGYAMMYGIQSFTETIAHEVVHAYQDHFSGGLGSPHGGDFFGMMKWAAKYPTTHFKHRYDVVAGKRLAAGLVPYWKREIRDGRLVGMACKVLTELEEVEGDVD